MASERHFAYDEADRAADAIKRRARQQPLVGLILGSGLGPLTEEIAEPVVIPYSDIPYFPVSTAPGHAGRLVLGRLQGLPVLAMSGRTHLYEGYRPEQVVLPVRAMHQLGIETILITNAAGGVNEAFHAGTLMVIIDHINLTGENPLEGPNDDRLGVRFPDMTDAYSPRLLTLAQQAASGIGLALSEGIYLGLRGPTYETPAEVRMARILGADAVGMSTVLEVIAASHLGMEVLGISCITNMAAGILPRKLYHAEVVDTAHRVYEEFSALIRGVLAVF